MKFVVTDTGRANARKMERRITFEHVSAGIVWTAEGKLDQRSVELGGALYIERWNKRFLAESVAEFYQLAGIQ